MLDAVRKGVEVGDELRIDLERFHIPRMGPNTLSGIQIFQPDIFGNGFLVDGADVVGDGPCSLISEGDLVDFCGFQFFARIDQFGEGDGRFRDARFLEELFVVHENLRVQPVR